MEGDSRGNKVPWVGVFWVKCAELIYELDEPNGQGGKEKMKENS